MPTTSPDNIKTPDLGQQYALVQDLAAMAATIQTALVRRANLYVGTSAQRTAFTSAPEGVHWQDTNGTKLEWVRQSGAWVQVTQVMTAVSLPIRNATANYSPAAFKQGRNVWVQGAISAPSQFGVWVEVATLPVGYRPQVYQYYPSGLQGISTYIGTAVRVFTNGVVEVMINSSTASVLPLSGINFAAA